MNSTICESTRSDYEKRGFCIKRNALDPERMQEIGMELEATMDRRSGETNVYVNGELHQEKKRPEDMREPHIDEPFWLGLCGEPKILDALEELIGPNLVLLMSHLFVKPPKEGMSIAWHQDIVEWAHISGSNICTVWLALDDVDLENGCMQVIPESHRGSPVIEKMETKGTDYLGRESMISDEQRRSAAPIELKAGEFSIHDAYLVHGSGSNTSQRRRAGYTMRYADPETLQIDPAQHWSPLYLVRGEVDWPAKSYVDARPAAQGAS
ncbi:MAG: phytanoyl-CoA dioxygenase family protein [Verrucomicrobia bacterium]|nr:phytanoyl-CoA dioxygenase family protein [Verrucomicrobiota bacterium]